jgi:hypothetical protein
MKNLRILFVALVFGFGITSAVASKLLAPQAAYQRMPESNPQSCTFRGTCNSEGTVDCKWKVSATESAVLRNSSSVPAQCGIVLKHSLNGGVINP